MHPKLSPRRHRAGRIALCAVTFSAALLSGCQEQQAAAPVVITDPVYSEVRVRHREVHDVKLVTYVKTASHTACKSASDEFVRTSGFADDDEWELTGVKCKDTIRLRFEQMFDNEQMQATYVTVDRTGGWSHDARLVIYGVPSTRSLEFCNQLAGHLQGRLGARVGCVKGHVG